MAKRRKTRILKFVALSSYSLIWIKGFMVGYPLLFFSIFGIFSFWSLGQIFAIASLIGLILSLSGASDRVEVLILSFGLLLSPLLWGLMKTPLSNFNYPAFYLPFGIFVVSYFLFLFHSHSMIFEEE